MEVSDSSTREGSSNNAGSSNTAGSPESMGSFESVGMVAFPLGRLGVLVPVNDRQTAALGLAMYTASKPWVVRAQNAAYWLVRSLGTPVLPGRRVRWTPPMEHREWRALVRTWESLLGTFEHVAVYHRRQASRSGLTLIATRRSDAPVVFKLRDAADSSLQTEQIALEHVGASAPTTFSVPLPLGLGTHGAWQWSAQSAVFTRPHRPCLHAPGELFQEITACLASAAGALPGDAAPDGVEAVLQHGDVTPWNLRVDHCARRWLFDWDVVAPAPVDSDRAFFHANAAALVGGMVDRDIAVSVPGAVWEHLIELVERRSLDNTSDDVLLERLQHALSAARAVALGEPGLQS